MDARRLRVVRLGEDILLMLGGERLDRLAAKHGLTRRALKATIDDFAERAFVAANNTSSWRREGAEHRLPRF